MSIVKLLLGIAFMSAILFFAFLNLEESVVVTLWPGAAHTYHDVPLVVAVFCAYLLGIVTYFIISLTRDIRFRARIARLRKENRALHDELHHLRGSALDDLPVLEAEEHRLQERSTSEGAGT